MKTAVVSIQDGGWLDRALDTLKGGGVVAFPTDTVYGVGTDPFNTDAVAKLYKAKGRPADKAIPILIGKPVDLSKVSHGVKPWVEKILAEFWPGALTVVLEKRSTIPKIVSSTETIGVRMPDHPIALELLRAAGPLAVTSANPSGAPEANDVSEVLVGLDSLVELVVDGGLSPGGLPSTVLDCVSYPPKVLREGPIDDEQISSLLGTA
jgi:L-threonylcarbamoyladenylate synthase